MRSDRPAPPRLLANLVLALAALTLGNAGDPPGTAPAATAVEAAPGLRGQVLGQDGVPVAEALVRCRTIDEAKPRVTHSGADGRFSFAATTGETYDVRVHAPGYAFWTGRDVDASTTLSVRLVRGLSLSGRVREETTGQGIPDATVRIDDDKTFALGGVELETSTDEDGRYVFAHAPPGTIWIRAKALRRATRSVRGSVGVDGAAPVIVEDLRLPEGGSLAGRVLDDEGAAIPGADVTLLAVDGFLGGHRNRFVSMSSVSDDEGFFSIDGVTAGTRYRVLARSDRHAPGSSDPLKIEPGDELTGVTVTLGAGASLRLRLLDPAEDPVTDLTLRLDSESDTGPDRTAQRRTLTTENGEIQRHEKGWLTVPHLQPGTYTVRLEPRAWKAIRRNGVTLVATETTDLGTIAVQRGSAVSGRVIDVDRAPVGNAEVVVRWRDFHGVYSRRTTSSEDGTFLRAGLPEFPVEVTASATGFADRVLEGVEVDGEAIEVTLARQGAITGRVRSADGGVPAALDVRAIPARSVKKPASRGVGSSGSFGIDGLDPGTYSVLVRSTGNAVARLDRVRVRAGATTDAGEISLGRGLRLVGQVAREADGAACPGATIRLDRGAGAVSWAAEAGDSLTVSDSSGRFALEGLESGRYTLTLDHPEFAPLQRSVDLNADAVTTDLELRLGAGGQILGTLVDADGLPLEGVDVYLFRPPRGYDKRWVATRADGSFQFPRLAPGTYVITLGRSAARSGFSSGIRTVDVRDGETAVVNFSDLGVGTQRR